MVAAGLLESPWGWLSAITLACGCGGIILRARTHPVQVIPTWWWWVAALSFGFNGIGAREDTVLSSGLFAVGALFLGVGIKALAEDATAGRLHFRRGVDNGQPEWLTEILEAAWWKPPTIVRCTEIDASQIHGTTKRIDFTFEVTNSGIRPIQIVGPAASGRLVLGETECPQAPEFVVKSDSGYMTIMAGAIGIFVIRQYVLELLPRLDPGEKVKFSFRAYRLPINAIDSARWGNDDANGPSIPLDFGKVPVVVEVPSSD